MKKTNRIHRLLVFVDGINWASRTFDCGRWKIARHLLRLYYRYDYRPAAAHHDGLSNPELGDDRLAAVISNRQLRALQRRLNPESHIVLTEDKAVFYQYARALGLPLPCMHAVMHRPSGWDRDGRPLRNLDEWECFLASLEGEIIVKPAAGVYGRGIRGFKRVDGGFEDDSSGELMTARALAQALLTDPWRRLVIQQRVWNHPDLESLTGTRTLQTLRIRTLVTSSGEVVVGTGKLKISRGRGLSDNIDGGRGGNFVAAVGLEDGRLGMPHEHAPSGRGIVSIPRHPNTGQAMEGFRVPFWDEAKTLARSAAVLFLPLKCIGWDIAVTGSGPVLIEGNRWWDAAVQTVALPGEETYTREMASFLRAMRTEAGRPQEAIPGVRLVPEVVT